MTKLRAAVGRVLRRSPQSQADEPPKTDKAMRERDNAIQIMGALQKHIDRRIEVLKNEHVPMRKRGA
jgi:hypothetical protein